MKSGFWCLSILPCVCVRICVVNCDIWPPQRVGGGGTVWGTVHFEVPKRIMLLLSPATHTLWLFVGVSRHQVKLPQKNGFYYFILFQSRPVQCWGLFSCAEIQCVCDFWNSEYIVKWNYNTYYYREQDIYPSSSASTTTSTSITHQLCTVWEVSVLCGVREFHQMI